MNFTTRWVLEAMTDTCHYISFEYIKRKPNFRFLFIIPKFPPRPFIVGINIIEHRNFLCQLYNNIVSVLQTGAKLTAVAHSGARNKRRIIGWNYHIKE
jgi:hypothetical protein